MARKRAAILEAAREAFLRLGYEGTSMEAIAAAAEVSIMTLYRHAERKEDLFAAVIAGACDSSAAEEQARFAELLQKPLLEALTLAGVMFQDKLASEQSIALLRVTIVESSHFPDIGEIAYRGLIGIYEEILDSFLIQRKEAIGLSASERRRLSAAFISRLVGADVIGFLLGRKPSRPAERRARAVAAAADLLAALPPTR